MSAGETARKHYESARMELIERIQLRDNVLLLYLGAVGTIFGVSIGTTARLEILLVIPYLALGASTIVSQHHAMIGSLGDFLAHEIEPFLREIGEYAPQWDTSEALKASSNMSTLMGRTLGHLLLIIIPPIAGLSLNWRHGFYLTFPEGLLWWSGVILTGMSIFGIWESHQWRMKLYRRLKSKLEDDDADRRTNKAVG